ncbi:putative serine/threonine-protein kinase PBL19 [Iris pallida]|uniref:Serine/threonine-protein kinase PBL19 n=1 Tax=Iris pallida TaxID=29817 RepID=A0AAX6HP38_IRIPA|nr:putative serine/threonine-protein kinase PBL19 [Iris pallida]
MFQLQLWGLLATQPRNICKQATSLPRVTYGATGLSSTNSSQAVPQSTGNRPRGEQKLLEWVRPYVSDAKKFRIILDPRLDGPHAMKSATKLSAIANRCLVGRPKSRPKMSEVLEMVEGLVESAEIGTPQPPLSVPAPQGSTSEEKEDKKKNNKNKKKKKRGLDLVRRMGEGRRLVWRGWTPKLVKTSSS